MPRHSPHPLCRRRRCSGVFLPTGPAEPPVAPAIGSGARVKGPSRGDGFLFFLANQRKRGEHGRKKGLWRWWGGGGHHDAPALPRPLSELAHHDEPMLRQLVAEVPRRSDEGGAPVLDLLAVPGFPKTKTNHLPPLPAPSA
jgi:hypothetical protein